ncbi:MAG TPA: hypothetical protein VJ375_04030, partial [Gaiellaceae bacterium]|nr:hypothetical protein [Gaiellaceae bacterium]
MIAVEHVDDQTLARLDCAARRRELGRRRVAERSLPEPDVVRRDVEVARQRAEPVERDVRRISFKGDSVVEVPAVQHGDARAGIADAEREVHDVVRDFGDPAGARSGEPPV